MNWCLDFTLHTAILHTYQLRNHSWCERTHLVINDILTSVGILEYWKKACDLTLYYSFYTTTFFLKPQQKLYQGAASMSLVVLLLFPGLWYYAWNGLLSFDPKAEDICHIPPGFYSHSKIQFIFFCSSFVLYLVFSQKFIGLFAFECWTCLFADLHLDSNWCLVLWDLFWTISHLYMGFSSILYQRIHYSIISH